MRLKKWLFLVILTGGLSHSLFSQVYFPEDMVKVSAQVLDDLSGLPISYVNVVNQRVRGGTIADKEGRFSLQADPSDTLTFKSIGYIDKRVPVSDVLKENAVVTMAPVRYELNGVEITGEGRKVNMTGVPEAKMSNTPAELRSDFTKKPTVLTAIVHPISFLNYKFNKTEKEKRHTLAAIRTDREWQLFSLVYNKEIAARLTGLHGEDLDNFMVYFNAFSNLRFSATTYEVEKRVKEVYKEYKGKLAKDEIPKAN